MKKIIILLFFIFFPSLSFATTYCIDSTTGNDSSSDATSALGDCSDVGTPYQTVSKALSSTPTKNAGDSVLFKRGSTFVLSASGSLAYSGTVGSYVNVTGATTASNWNRANTLNSAYDSNIWYMTFNTEYTKKLKLDSTEYTEARMPSQINSTNRWAWYPSDYTGNTHYLFLYSTANPASTYSTIEYLDNSGNITLGAYGSGNDPILTCVQRVSGSDTGGNWTDNSGTVANTWYMTLATDPQRLWLDSTEKASASTVSGGSYPLSSTRPWKWDSGTSRLYIYSAGVNPATAYALIEGNQICQNIISFTNRSYITFDNLDIRGGRVSVLQGRGSRGIIFQNGSIGYGGNGILFTGGAAATYVPNQYIIVRDMVLDHQERFGSEGYDDMSGVANGIELRESGENFLIYRNTIKNFDHDELAFNSFNSTSAFFDGIFNGRVYANNVHSADNYDGRSFSFVTLPNKSHDVELFYNLFHHTYTQSKLDAGDNVIVHHNLFYNGANPTYNTAEDVSEFIVYICLDSTYESDGTILENNVFYNNVSSCLKMDQQSSSSCVKQNHILRNNIFMDCATDPINDALHANIQLRIEKGSNVGANTYKNNLLFRTGTTSSDNLVRYDTTNYTVSGFNALTGDASNTISNNIYGNPGFTDVSSQNFRINSGSIAKDAGVSGTSVYADYDGDKMPKGINVDIGAFEADTREAKGVTLRGVTIR